MVSTIDLIESRRKSKSEPSLAAIWRLSFAFSSHSCALSRCGASLLVSFGPRDCRSFRRHRADGGWEDVDGLAEVFPVGFRPIVRVFLLRRGCVELAVAHQIAQFPLKLIFPLCVPGRLDRAPRLGPEVAFVIGAADAQRNEMVDLKVRVRPRRQSVLNHDVIVARAIPVTQLPGAGGADFAHIGSSNGAGSDGRVGDDSLRADWTGQQNKMVIQPAGADRAVSRPIRMRSSASRDQ